MNNVTADTMESILEYLYTGKCYITFANVKQLMLSAYRMSLTSLESTCIDEVKLDVNNWLEFRKFAEEHQLKRLKELTDTYATLHL